MTGRMALWPAQNSLPCLGFQKGAGRGGGLPAAGVQRKEEFVEHLVQAALAA